MQLGKKLNGALNESEAKSRDVRRENHRLIMRHLFRDLNMFDLVAAP